MADEPVTPEVQEPESVPAPDVAPIPETIVHETIVPEVETPEQPEEEPFDKDRALRLIEKLRGEEKRAKHLERENAAYKQREIEAERAKMSELDRLHAELKDRDAALETERQQRSALQNSVEVQRLASTLGIVDADAAERLLDWSQVERDTDGRPTNLEDALSRLIAERPYLKAPPAAPQPRSQATNGPTRPQVPGQRIYTQAELADFRFYQAHQADIAAAYREGRIKTD